MPSQSMWPGFSQGYQATLHSSAAHWLYPCPGAFAHLGLSASHAPRVASDLPVSCQSHLYSGLPGPKPL